MALISRRLYLDVDGVLADFEGAVFEHFKVPRPAAPWAPFTDVHDFVGMNRQEFWSKPVFRQKRFWADLPLCPGAVRLVSGLKALCRPYDVSLRLCTAGFPEGSGAWAGRSDWIEKHFPDLRASTIVCPEKYELAGPPRERFLVDDSDEQVRSFRRHGGCGVLFPALYNEMKHRVTETDFDPVGYVLDIVDAEFANVYQS